MTEEGIIPVQHVMRTDPAHTALPRAPEWTGGAGYVIDRFVPIDHAAIPITDLGFLRADAVYDVVTVSRGHFFRLKAHQERFARSCARMKLTNPFEAEAEARLLHKLVAKTGLRDAYVWWTVTRGANPRVPADRLHPDRFTNRFYAFVIPYVFIKEDKDRQIGINLMVSRDYIRIPQNAVDPRAKNFCSLDLNMSLLEAGASGAHWSVMTDGNGRLTESPGSNIFILKGGRILTPDNGCLEGVTGQTVFELGAKVGIEVKAEKVTTADLEAADEVFLTSSAGGIIPVSAVDGKQLSAGVGPVTTRLHNLYWELRWQGWHGTAVDYGDEE